MPFPQASRHLAAHLDLVRKRGDWVRHAKGRRCPCGESVDRAVPTCRLCRGLGFFWEDWRWLRALVTSAEQETKLLALGVAAPGDLVLGPGLHPWARRIDQWDLVVPRLPFGQPFQGETLVRQGTVDTLQWEPARVEACYMVDPRSGLRATFLEGADFVVEGAGLRWLPGRGPAIGERYAIHYRPRFEYLALVPPMPRVERNTGLGDKVILRKRHLALRQLLEAPE